MLERLADAAASLLEEKGLEETTVAEIAAEAGASVGSFYRRFPDKTAMLHYLDERLAGRSRRWLEVGPEEPVENLESMLRRLTAPWVRSYVRDRGVRRALHLRARVDPAFRARAAETERVAAERVAEALALVPEIAGISPESLGRLAGQIVLQGLGFLREAVLFRELQVVPTPATEEEILEVMTATQEGLVRWWLERRAKNEDERVSR